ncbi:MAG: hypothetical protein JNL72_00415 [Flavipsychrobacter sp.]|nr:hypothetical protein [Flavipsychrobacter sp.]
MRIFATLALVWGLSVTAFADGEKTRIGSLPLKDGSVMVVQEYLSKARLPEKVVITSPYEEVYAFKGGVVTKVLEIDDRYSVFVKNGDHYYVYNNIYALAVNDGDHLERGELLGSLRYDKRFGEYQMEMQIWEDNGRNTCRLVNNHVVCILAGKPYIPRPEPRPKAKSTHKGKSAKHASSTRGKKTTSKKYASKSRTAKSKAVKSKSVKSKTAKPTTKARKAPAKKAPAKKKKK